MPAAAPPVPGVPRPAKPTVAEISATDRALVAAALAALPRRRTLDLVLDRAALDARAEGDDRIPIAMSSEAPVLRYDWWEDERYYEVLDHGPGSVDLSYARDGMAYLLEHSRGDQHGLIEDVALGSDRVLRGMLRFSAAQRSQEIRQDVLDGIRKKVSVGYRLSDTYDQTAGGKGEPATRRYRGWVPMECSSVSIPADYAMGYGRTGDALGAPDGEALTQLLAQLPPHLHDAVRAVAHGALHARTTPPQSPPPPAARGQDPTMKEDDKAAESGGNGGGTGLAVTRAEGEQAERRRVNDVLAVCGEHAVDEKETQRFISEGTPLPDVQRSVLEIVRKRMANPTLAGPRIELNDKEARRFSFARAIADSLDDAPLGVKFDAGFEREVSAEIEKNLPNTYKRRGGLLLPTVTRKQTIDEAIAAAERAGREAFGAYGSRAGLDSGAAGYGKETVFTVPGDFLSLLRAKMRVRALGARVLPGLTGPLSFPRQTSAANGSWVGENSGSDVGDSRLGTGIFTISPKTYQASTSYSRQLLVAALSGSIDAEMMVRGDLAASHGLAFDAAAIVGTGATYQPRGVINTAGVNVIAVGANGGALDWPTIIAFETAVAAANAEADSMGWLTHPVLRGNLKGKARLGNTIGLPIWGDDNTLNGYRAEVSTQSPSGLTKGTSSDCYAATFGDWSRMVIGEWGVIEIITDPLRLKKQGMIELTSFQMGDVGVQYPQAFSVCVDARNA